METVAVVLSVGKDRVEEFEAGFREHELPVWQDLAGARPACPRDPEPAGHLVESGRWRDPVPGVGDLLERRGPPRPRCPPGLRGLERDRRHVPGRRCDGVRRRDRRRARGGGADEDRRDRPAGLGRRVRRLGSARRLAADDRGRAAGRPARLRVDLAVRPLPHRAPPDRRDHVRVVHVAGGARRADRAGPARPRRHLHRVPQPGPHREDDLDDGLDQRRPDGPRHRGRLEARRVARLRLRLPRDEGAAGPARRRPRGHHRDARRRQAPARDVRGQATRRSATRSTSRSRSSSRGCRSWSAATGRT